MGKERETRPEKMDVLRRPLHVLQNRYTPKEKIPACLPACLLACLLITGNLPEVGEVDLGWGKEEAETRRKMDVLRRPLQCPTEPLHRGRKLPACLLVTGNLPVIMIPDRRRERDPPTSSPRIFFDRKTQPRVLLRAGPPRDLPPPHTKQHGYQRYRSSSRRPSPRHPRPPPLLASPPHATS